MPNAETAKRPSFGSAEASTCRSLEVQNPDARFPRPAKIQKPESRIRNPESRIKNPESRIQNPGSRIHGSPESRCQIPETCSDPEARIQNPESEMQNRASRIQNRESRIQNQEFRIQNPGARFQQTGGTSGLKAKLWRPCNWPIHHENLASKPLPRLTAMVALVVCKLYLQLMLPGPASQK